MPIEIRELHIRVTVNQPEGAAAGGQSGTSADAGTGSSGDKDALVRQCAEEVLRILRDERER